MFRLPATGLVLALVLSVPFSAVADTTHFQFFNAFSLKDIGRADDPYEGDISGIVGCQGGCSFSGVSLNEAGEFETRFSLHSGKSVGLRNGTILNGGVEAAGNVTLFAVEVDGSISCGGDVKASEVTVAGDIDAGGKISLHRSTVRGEVRDKVPFSASMPLDAVARFFSDKSKEFSEWRATGTPILDDQLVFTARAGTNVFHISAEDLSVASGVAIAGDPHAAVIINVSGEDAKVSNLTWLVDPAIDLHSVLLNFYEAGKLGIDQVAVVASILAPLAAVDFKSGIVLGGLWVGDLQGAGEIDFGFFIEPDAPTPVNSASWGGIKARFEPATPPAPAGR